MVPRSPSWCSRSDRPAIRWRDILIKVGEYLTAGVLKVVVLDPGKRKAHIYSADEEPMVLGPEDELTFPGLLEGFRVPVHRFFD